MLLRKTLAAGALAAGCLIAAQTAAAAPTGDVSAQLDRGTLTVRGGDDVDLVDVRARGLTIEVGVGDASAGRFPLWAVRRIRVETGAGDDRVTLDDGPLALLRFTPVTVDGGDGYDVAATSGAPTGDELSVDRFGHAVELDRHRFGAAVRLRTTEQLTAATGGGADAVHVGALGDALLQLDVELGADDRTDRIAVDGTDGPDQVDAFGFGGTVIVSGVTFVHLSDAEQRDALTIAGGPGDDKLSANTGAFHLSSTLLGGPGDDQLTGGDDAERLVGGGGGDFAQGNQGADDLDLGAGNDIVRWDEGDGGDTIAAGGGTFDALTMWGDATAESFALEPDGHDARMTAGGEVIALDALERIETVAQVGADAYHLGDLSGTAVTDVIVSLSGVPATPALDGAVDAMTVDGTDGDDALAIAGNTGEARVTGLPVRLAIQRTEPADTLAIAGGAGTDTLDTSGLLPGAITATLTD